MSVSTVFRPPAHGSLGAVVLPSFSCFNIFDSNHYSLCNGLFFAADVSDNTKILYSGFCCSDHGVNQLHNIAWDYLRSGQEQCV